MVLIAKTPESIPTLVEVKKATKIPIAPITNGVAKNMNPIVYTACTQFSDSDNIHSPNLYYSLTL